MRKDQILTKEQSEKLDKIHNKIFWALKHKKAYPYPKGLFDSLRPYSFGGFPISILVLINELCNGFCYDRASLMSLAFDDATIVHGDVESLRITSSEDDSPEHAFVETKAFGGHKTWVIDTSMGLIYEKKFYYELEKVKVNRVIPKEVIMQSPDIHDILTANFENDKYALPMTMPLIENAIKASNHLGTVMYKKVALQELENFKAAIHYDEIVAEVEADIQMMYHDPHKLEEKFQIVRDKCGREISRNGVPNPYYISPEDADAMQVRYDAVKDNPEELLRLIAEDSNLAFRQAELERAETARKAQIRLKEIEENPTANYYDTPQPQ